MVLTIQVFIIVPIDDMVPFYIKNMFVSQVPCVLFDQGLT